MMLLKDNRTYDCIIPSDEQMRGENVGQLSALLIMSRGPGMWVTFN